MAGSQGNSTLGDMKSDITDAGRLLENIANDEAKLKTLEAVLKCHLILDWIYQEVCKGKL